MEPRKFVEKTIPVDKINVIRSRDRDEGSFRELKDSLKMLQIKPVFVKERDDGSFDLFSGEGRLKALMQNGEKQIDALVFPKDQLTEKEILIEWIVANARRDAPPLDIARLMAYDREKGLSYDEIGAKYGKKPSTVRQKLRTLEFAAPEVIQSVEKGEIRFDQAQEVVGRISDKETQKLVVETITTERLNPTQTGSVISKAKQLQKDLGRLPKMAELRKTLRSQDSLKSDLNETVQSYLDRESYLLNFTTMVLEDVKFLKLLNQGRLTFNDLLN